MKAIEKWLKIKSKGIECRVNFYKDTKFFEIYNIRTRYKYIIFGGVVCRRCHPFTAQNVRYDFTMSMLSNKTKINFLTINNKNFYYNY